MREVVCWCCEYFELSEISDPFYKLIHGIKDCCSLKNKGVNSEDAVCEDFLLRSGLFTKRSIPERCKNYHNSNQKP